MAHLSIQCQNCGAKYKIPETFTGDRAKCKACGNVIDVKASREAATTQAGEKPTTAEAAAGKSSRESRKSAGTPRRRRTAEKTAGADEVTSLRSSSARRRESSLQRGQRRPKKRDNSWLIAGGAILVLAAVALGLWSTMDTGDSESTEQTTQTPAVETPPPPEEVTAATENDPTETQASEASTKPKPKLAGPEAFLAELKTQHDTNATLITGSVLETLELPEGLTEEANQEITALLDDLREDGGLNSIRAPGKLQAMGFRMIPLTMNRLLTLDQAKPEDIVYANNISDTISGIAGTSLRFYFPSTDLVEIEQCFENCSRVREMYMMTQRYFLDEAGVADYIKDFKDRDTSKLKGPH